MPRKHGKASDQRTGGAICYPKQNAPTQSSPGALSRTALPRSLLNSQSTVRAPDAEGHIRNNVLVTFESCTFQCVCRLRRLLLPLSDSSIVFVPAAVETTTDHVLLQFIHNTV